ncbi:MFS transporter [Duganella sp. BJB488]|uniref:MFS transporter n=1 Tax=unclassified Duganella TaxID=2636909 RepID=UPI000E355C70|nr:MULTISPECIES: MFS transporter [unclassified Duganella]RFP20174.1 MFS transporter [Duganella sp. BJB489]RFP21378.1 MFS transporter [Duganella sp. BJB488]RFP33519.1 MFS transporter [Duganella sp. BJB480]
MNDTSLLRQDARIIGLVGLAHGTSHFYHVILAALIPWLKPEFQLSYAELGLLMTVFFTVSGVGQAMAGFVVDRYSARTVLFGGIALLGLSAVMLSSAHSYAQLMLGAFLAGCGNSVFHPADYTLLNQRVSKARLAHGFSVHGISGNIGWALSPLFLTFVASRTDWRTALLSAALLPLAVLALLVWNRHALRPEPAPVPTAAAAAAAAGKGGALGFLRLQVVWMCFAFFLISAVALAGIQSFAATSLVSLYGMSLAWATTAYTAYMIASAVGMLYGGFLGAGSRHHDRIIMLAFGSAALMALLLAAAVVPAWMAVVLMGAIGLVTGISGPSRDLLIRGAAPANATGRVFGVVYSGLDSGLALGPLLFGALMDANHPSGVFIGIAVFQALVILTTLGVGSKTRVVAVPKTA